VVAAGAVIHRAPQDHQIHAPIPEPNPCWDRNPTGNDQGMDGMTELQDRLALEREEISARVASFKATQEKFQREREEYYTATMEAARSVRWNKYVGGVLSR
jgi:hypothetical protein